MSKRIIKQEEHRKWTGKRLAFFRKKVDMSQAQLAGLVPCSTDLISRIERGIQDPTFQIICSITHSIGITPNDLCPIDLLNRSGGNDTHSYAGFLGIADTPQSGIDFGKAKDMIVGVLRGLHPMRNKSADTLESFVLFCSIPRSRREMMDFCQIKANSHFRDYILYPLLKRGFLQRTVPEKPSSPDQRYFLTIPDSVIHEVESQNLRQKQEEEQSQTLP